MDAAVESLLREIERELQSDPQPGGLFTFLQQHFPTSPLLWNACKHLARSEQGAKVEELEAALWYLQQELKRCKGS